MDYKAFVASLDADHFMALCVAVAERHATEGSAALTAHEIALIEGRGGNWTMAVNSLRDRTGYGLFEAVERVKKHPAWQRRMWLSSEG